MPPLSLADRAAAHGRDARATVANRMRPRNRQSAIGNRKSAFTLVEALISIAIALLLIIGVSQIFSIAQRTTGAGNAILEIAEANRAVQNQFLSDFRQIDNLPNESPGLVITSFSVGAWRNKSDMTSDRDANVLTANDPSGTGSLPLLYAGAVNSRVHRIDKLCFFARGQFDRQTADAPNLTSPTTSSEAFIWLGHLKLPNNPSISSWEPFTLGLKSGDYFPPGYVPAVSGVKNDNNLFASDWILGREVILLTPGAALAERSFLGPPIQNNLDPLSLVTSFSTNDSIPLYLSRYDLASTSIDEYRRFILRNPGHDQFNWWEHLSGTISNTSGGSTQINDYRYAATPFVRKPPPNTDPKKAAQWMSAAVAQSSPIFVRGCTQFIVEFAGNFTTQDDDPLSRTYGDVKVAVPDPTGKLDFIVDRNNQGFPIGTRIRWYGFPRDTNGDGKIDWRQDVVTLNDVLINSRQVRQLPKITFERTPLPVRQDLNKLPFQSTNNASVSDFYVCAWGPDTDALGIARPKMIRITLAIDDPTGRLSSEQYFQYVYELP